MILITGGCGFIGHHFVEHILRNTKEDVTVLDKLTYASFGFDRLRDIQAFDGRRVRVFTGNLAEPVAGWLAFEIGTPDAIIHLAAETSVDRSLRDPTPFVLSNVMATVRIYEYARTLKNPPVVLYFSTDEVFGPAEDGVFFDENAPFRPSNPYAASKAGGEAMAMACERSWGVPTIIVHCMNVFGQRQHPEKFIPKCIRYVLDHVIVPIHSDPKTGRSGSRCWIHARNVADACLFLLNRVKTGVWNIVGEEHSNLEVAQFIASTLNGKLHYEMVDWHSSRPGHDPRYALSGEKLKKLGWTPPHDFATSLANTVNWSARKENKRWLYAPD